MTGRTNGVVQVSVFRDSRAGVYGTSPYHSEFPLYLQGTLSFVYSASRKKDGRDVDKPMAPWEEKCGKGRFEY